ncbi:MAG TPA: dihydropteroate synthase [Steroidobacteraceae bacterium]|nr:dihydropteroate synthase [Steroidobacteraceae bacterium]
MLLNCGDRAIDLSEPRVMGILNVTPDSFSDGGRYADHRVALDRARRMVEQGAAIIDVGGESTRPGSEVVDAAEEMRRVVPVIQAIADHLDVAISIDTNKAAVMEAAIDAGAHLINDVRALQEPGALELAAQSRAAVCLMHMQGNPKTMQQEPHYVDVVGEVAAFLRERAAACEVAGIDRSRILIDPGIGFGKRLEHNLALLAATRVLAADGLPVLIGVSRKSMFSALLGRAVEERMVGGVAVATAAVLAGAKVIRTHDVRETVDAVRVAHALRVHGYASFR